MEIQGKQVTTRGVPEGYGYIRKRFPKLTKYWPVRLIKNGYEYLRDDKDEIAYQFSREDCLAFIQEYPVNREASLTRRLKDNIVELEMLQQWDATLVSEWNALTNYLSEVFSMKVTGNVDENRKASWQVEYAGGKLTGYETMAEAFRAGVEASLEKYKDSSNMFRQAAKEWNEGKR